MRLLGISILCLLYSFSLFGQCGGYLDFKSKADSSYKSNSFKEASYYYSKCLGFEEKKRVDYYYTAISYIKMNQPDSALVFFKVATKNGLHYNTLRQFYSDTIIQNFTKIKKWRKTINLVKQNTEKYVLNKNIDSVLLKTILTRMQLDQKYRSPQMNQLPLNVSDSLWQIQKKYDQENQFWLKGEIEKNGWPIISRVGIEGDNATWLIVQHADNDTIFQHYCLNILKKLWLLQETSSKNVAYLEDRLLVNSNKEQIYGTQFETIIADNKIVDLKLKPTINKVCLNKRRLYMELEPIEDYLEFAKKRYIQH